MKINILLKACGHIIMKNKRFYIHHYLLLFLNFISLSTYTQDDNITIPSNYTKVEITPGSNDVPDIHRYPYIPNRDSLNFWLILKPKNKKESVFKIKMSENFKLYTKNYIPLEPVDDKFITLDRGSENFILTFISPDKDQSYILTEHQKSNKKLYDYDYIEIREIESEFKSPSFVIDFTNNLNFSIHDLSLEDTLIRFPNSINFGDKDRSLKVRFKRNIKNGIDKLKSLELKPSQKIRGLFISKPTEFNDTTLVWYLTYNPSEINDSIKNKNFALILTDVSSTVEELNTKKLATLSFKNDYSLTLNLRYFHVALALIIFLIFGLFYFWSIRQSQKTLINTLETFEHRLFSTIRQNVDTNEEEK